MRPVVEAGETSSFASSGAVYCGVWYFPTSQAIHQCMMRCGISWRSEVWSGTAKTHPVAASFGETSSRPLQIRHLMWAVSVLSRCDD